MPGPQPPMMPGYSPLPMSQQTTPFLRTPGAQGLPEGAAGGQGTAFTPSQQFFGGGGQPVAPPSSLPAQSAPWSAFGGSGEAPSSSAWGGGAPQQLPEGGLASIMQSTQQGTPWRSATNAGSPSTGPAMPAPMQPQPGSAAPFPAAAGMGQAPGAAMFSGLPGMGSSVPGMPGMGGAMSVPNVISALGGGGQRPSLGPPGGGMPGSL